MTTTTASRISKQVEPSQHDCSTGIGFSETNLSSEEKRKTTADFSLRPTSSYFATLSRGHHHECPLFSSTINSGTVVKSRFLNCLQAVIFFFFPTLTVSECLLWSACFSVTESEPCYPENLNWLCRCCLIQDRGLTAETGRQRSLCL